MRRAHKLAGALLGVAAVCLAAGALPGGAAAGAVERVAGAGGAPPAAFGNPPVLKRKHPGWRQTACLDCHAADKLKQTHDKEKGVVLEPAGCGPCHGYNGAPHEDHAIAINHCESCHGLVEHVAKFPSPDACIKCHNQPVKWRGR